MKKAYLVLADGTVFEGFSFGAEGQAIGELAFTTNMVGYLESITDSGFAGQIVVQTFPLMGNYGVIEEDSEGSCAIRGYVAREWCDAPSNFRSQLDLDAYLKQQGVPAICGIDTRALTRKIRECGAMNAMICSEIPSSLSEIKSYRVSGAVESVSTKESISFPAAGEEKYHVAAIDYGMKRSLIAELQQRGCRVTAVPALTGTQDILALKPDGILLTGGPGNPAENEGCIAEIKALLGKLPIFAVGLGHQMLAIAAGARTEKLHCGHRGANQPVKSAGCDRSYITSQNHGYAVVSESVQQGEISFVNANDGGCEGIDYPSLRAFGVQFHPESISGPRCTSFLFERFISMMGGER